MLEKTTWDFPRPFDDKPQLDIAKIHQATHIKITRQVRLATTKHFCRKQIEKTLLN